MSLCPKCGNEVALATLGTVNANCGPVCVACQHTGRTGRKTMAELQAHALAAVLGATYAALMRVQPDEEEIEAALTVKEAQESLSCRIRDQQHSRVRPDLEADAEEEREREPVCQSCHGTGRWLYRRCPDCSEDGDRERD